MSSPGLGLFSPQARGRTRRSSAKVVVETGGKENGAELVPPGSVRALCRRSGAGAAC